MNETIILSFRDYTPDKARMMLEAARTFATSKPDGRPGLRHGTVMAWTGLTVFAYWTKTRTVVVRELEGE